MIMAGWVKCQAGSSDDRLKHIPLKLGDRWFVVELVCPLLFVINNGKQGDQLFCQINGHHSSTFCHHRSCDCLYEDLDDPDVERTFLSTEAINYASQHGSHEELRQLSINKCDNAFNRVQTGQNPYGIFMCAAIDVMHTIQHGIIFYSLDCFKKCLSVQSLATLDKMASFPSLLCKREVGKSSLASILFNLMPCWGLWKAFDVLRHGLIQTERQHKLKLQLLLQ